MAPRTPSPRSSWPWPGSGPRLSSSPTRAGRAVLLRGPAVGPRGLRPEGVAERIAAASGVELESLKADLRPRAEGPWYEAADVSSLGEEGDGSQASPAALMGPLVLHELRAHGFDAERIAAAAHSVAWLTVARPKPDRGSCALRPASGRGARARPHTPRPRGAHSRVSGLWCVAGPGLVLIPGWVSSCGRLWLILTMWRRLGPCVCGWVGMLGWLGLWWERLLDSELPLQTRS